MIGCNGSLYGPCSVKVYDADFLKYVKGLLKKTGPWGATTLGKALARPGSRYLVFLRKRFLCHEVRLPVPGSQPSTATAEAPLPQRTPAGMDGCN